jgi:aspartyl-tRNA(Asn)/glutamyl-tRNA(Gln) amidotransferase subunit C
MVYSRLERNLLRILWLRLYFKFEDMAMSEEITREIFDKIVELAALELEEDEAEYIRRQLNDQLAAIAELEAVPLDEDTPPAAHGVPFTPVVSAPARQDRHAPFAKPEEILEIAPDEEERYFVTPDIPHEDLG